MCRACVTRAVSWMAAIDQTRHQTREPIKDNCKQEPPDRASKWTLYSLPISGWAHRH